MKLVIVILYILLMGLMVGDMSADDKTETVLFEEVWFSKLARQFGFVVVHESQWDIMYKEYNKAVEIVRGYELKNNEVVPIPITGLRVSTVEGEMGFVDFSSNKELP